MFDFFHLGHLRLFNHAAQLGDSLIVAVQETDSILKTKPNAKTIYSTKDRIEMIEGLNVVKRVITYQDVDMTIPKTDFDVFAIGEDQVHDGFKRAENWCLSHGKAVVRMKRTRGISSGEIKRFFEDEEKIINK